MDSVTPALPSNLRALGIIGAGVVLVLLGTSLVVVGAMSMGSVAVVRVPMAGGGLLLLSGLLVMIGGTRSWFRRRQV